MNPLVVLGVTAAALVLATPGRGRSPGRAARPAEQLPRPARGAACAHRLREPPWDVLGDALRRLLARLAGADEQQWPPELLELDRRAQVAMTLCTCGHMWHLHEHPHVRTGCDACACQRFRPAQRPGTSAGQGAGG